MSRAISKHKIIQKSGGRERSDIADPITYPQGASTCRPNETMFHVI